MAEVHGKTLDHTVNTVALEENTSRVTISVDQDVSEVTAATDSAKEHLPGIYGWQMEGEYRWNPSAGKNDATIYAALTSGAIAVDCTPGGGAVGHDNPKYNGNAMVKRYQISIPHDGVITSRATFVGDDVLTRSSGV